MDILSEERIVTVVVTLACDKMSTFWGGQTIRPFWVRMLQESIVAWDKMSLGRTLQVELSRRCIEGWKYHQGTL